MGGCLACYDKPDTINPANEAPKGVKSQAGLRNPDQSEGFWTNSTLDMENNISYQSQGSISSISTTNLTVNSQGGVCTSSDPPEFVNHGFVLWNQTRQSWTEKKMPENRGRRVQKPRMNWNKGHESLLSSSNKPFPQPIPLAEMVDFLVEIWEEEGLF